MPKALDITEQRYGKLVALHQVRKDQRGHWIWAFQCDCGNVKLLKPGHVRRKVDPVKSCGCGHQKRRAHFIAKRDKATIEDLEDVSW